MASLFAYAILTTYGLSQIITQVGDFSITKSCVELAWLTAYTSVTLIIIHYSNLLTNEVNFLNFIQGFQGRSDTDSPFSVILSSIFAQNLSCPSLKSQKLKSWLRPWWIRSILLVKIHLFAGKKDCSNSPRYCQSLQQFRDDAIGEETQKLYFANLFLYFSFKQLDQLSQQIAHRYPIVSCKLFTFDWSLIFNVWSKCVLIFNLWIKQVLCCFTLQMTAAVATYLIIVLNFQNISIKK